VQELLQASKVLGVSNVGIYGITSEYLTNIPAFQDGPNESWDASLIAKVVEHYSKLWQADYIVTFDQVGVSGHPNHKDTHKGVLHHASQYSTKSLNRITYLQLRSTPQPVKYMSWIGVLLEQQRTNNQRRLFFNFDEMKVWQAMYAHKSQLLWFRYLYLLLSTHISLNVLENF